MRLFLVLAAACFVVAIIVAAGVTVLSFPAVGWIAAGLLAYVLDLEIGGVVPAVGNAPARQ
jgi:hypothetical protein